MRVKPFPNFKSILYLIFIIGIILDTYSVYIFWVQVNDNEQINQILANANTGIDLESFEAKSIVEIYQKVFNILLIGFLLWDYVAYCFFLKYKEWARKYVLSIAIFYLITCLWQLSFSFGLYGLFTTYYLWGAKKEFA